MVWLNLTMTSCHQDMELWKICQKSFGLCSSIHVTWWLTLAGVLMAWCYLDYQHSCPNFFSPNMDFQLVLHLLWLGLWWYLQEVSKKYINCDWQFGIAGIKLIFFLGLGTFTGGYITKRFKLNRSQVIKMYIYCQIVTIPCGFAVMLSCPTPNLAGVNTPYPESTIPVVALSEAKTVLSPEDLQMQCNQECSCDFAVFDPICDKTKNVMYYR